MANVELIDYTGRGCPNERWHAAHMLVFTKGARLGLTPKRFIDVVEMSREELQAELNAMAETIPSSWEFADTTFLITGLTRAAAQQMTRTRTGSYAMQSQRVTNAGEAEVANPFPQGETRSAFEVGVKRAKLCYLDLMSRGAEPGDARGILPINTTCNLVAKYNLRSLVELVRARESLRTQGEYADVVSQMKAAVLAAWPWAHTFFRPPNVAAIEIIERVAREAGWETGSGPGWQLAKAADLLRKGK